MQCRAHCSRILSAPPALALPDTSPDSRLFDGYPPPERSATAGSLARPLTTENECMCISRIGWVLWGSVPRALWALLKRL